MHPLKIHTNRPEQTTAEITIRHLLKSLLQVKLQAQILSIYCSSCWCFSTLPAKERPNHQQGEAGAGRENGVSASWLAD